MHFTRVHTYLLLFLQIQWNFFHYLNIAVYSAFFFEIFAHCFSFLIGLIVKQMLTRAAESSCEQENNLAKNTTGVIFYSTPHAGSQAAKLNATAK